MTTATTVILGGALGEEFGREWKLFIDSKVEALKLIGANFPEFRLRLIQMVDQGMDFHVVEDDREITLEEMNMPAGKRLVFMPVMQGAGGGGIFQTILGVAMVALALSNPAWLGTYATYVGATGAALAVTGIASMLARQPKMGDLGKEDSAGLKSYFFDGAVQMEEQGAAVTVAYGRNLLSAAATINATIRIK